MYRLYWHPFEKHCKPTRNYIDGYVLLSLFGCCVCASGSAPQRRANLPFPLIALNSKLNLKFIKKEAKSIFGCASCHAFSYCVNSFFFWFGIWFGLLLLYSGRIVHALRTDVVIIDVNRTICVHGTIDPSMGLPKWLRSQNVPISTNFWKFDFCNFFSTIRFHLQTHVTFWNLHEWYNVLYSRCAHMYTTQWHSSHAENFDAL